MAARKVQLKDNSGNKAYPVTSSACVGMSDGSGSLDKYIQEFEERGYLFAGVATPSTNPGAPDGKVFYLAGGGLFANFLDYELPAGLNIIYNVGSSWATRNLISIKNSIGDDENAVMSQFSVSKNITEFNASVNFPTEGTDGTNKYTLLNAISKLPSVLRNPGIKISFINENNEIEKWEFQGGNTGDLGAWIQTNASNILGQINDVNNKYCLYFDPNKIGYFNNSVSFVSKSNYVTSITKCQEGDKYIIRGNSINAGCTIVFFDENFDYLSSDVTTDGNTRYAIAPINSAFCALSKRTDVEQFAYKYTNSPYDINGLNNINTTDVEIYGIDKVIQEQVYIQKSNGNAVSNSGYIGITDYIKCYGGYIFVIGNNNNDVVASVALYNENKEYLNTSLCDSNVRLYKVPTEASYFRLTFRSDFKFTYICEDIKGKRIDDNLNEANKYCDNLVEENVNDINNRLESGEAISFMFDRTNLLNTKDPDYKTQAYLKSNGTEGSITTSPTWAISGFIPFKEEDGYLTQSTDSGAASPANGYNCLYNVEKNLVASFTGSSAATLQWQEGVAYARFTFSNLGDKKPQVNIGSTALPYKDYSNINIKNDYLPEILNLPSSVVTPLGGYGLRYEWDTLSNNFTDSTFPQMIKGRNILSFSCEFNAFSTLSISRGVVGAYSNGYKLTVSSDKSVKFQINTGETEETLTNDVSKFLKIIIEEDMLFKHVKVTIMTLGGYDEFIFAISSGYRGAFSITNSNALLNVKLTITNNSLKEPVWLFGDSYMDFLWNSFHNIIKSNMMIDGYGGTTSQTMYSELLRCLNYSCPKTLIWGLGMNDEYNSYITYYNNLQTLAETYGFDVIYYAPPTVPERDKEAFRTFLIENNARFIDAYSAVGANSIGVWYDNYLGSDNVHPTTVGSNAIAIQYMVDCPELCNFKKYIEEF